MRISDWSSDVCSSDLLAIDPHRIVGFGEQRGRHIEAWGVAVQQITASLVRAFAHAHIEVALIAVDLSLIDHRADLRARLERMINHHRPDALGHSSNEAVRSEEHTSELQSLMLTPY